MGRAVPFPSLTQMGGHDPMRRGVWFGLIAYGLWGLFPLYWPLLRPSAPVEILAHRILWSALVMTLIALIRRGWSVFRTIKRRTWLLVIAAGALISVNWGIYIYAVNNGQVIDAALGYFINPLVSVGLGVLVLRERLRPFQWIAIGLATAGVVVLAVEAGGLPIVGLCLAASFALYGLVKKVIPLAPVDSLTGETWVLVPLAVLYLGVLMIQGHSTFSGAGGGHAALLVGTGVITVIPLVAFAAAAQRLSLTQLGLLQYLTPTAQFLLGVFWAHEPMAPSRLIGFGIIWLALALYTADTTRSAHRRRRAAVPTA